MAFLKLITLAEDIRYRVVVSRIIIGKHISVPRLKVTLTVFILKGKGNIRCLFGYRMLFSLFFPFFFFCCPFPAVLSILLQQYCQVPQIVKNTRFGFFVKSPGFHFCSSAVPCTWFLCSNSVQLLIIGLCPVFSFQSSF